ncbi:MAG: NRDE family protein [Halioglobus sp.]
MCLIIFAHHYHPGAPLVLAANRDEFFARPTATANFWPEHPNLLAGRDLEQGGAWMGITRGGRFAAITNFRDPAATVSAPRTRGELTLDYLIGNESAQQYLLAVAARQEEYAGFNLLLGDRQQLWFLSNSGEAREAAPKLLPPGLYGLSNAALDTPWPKVVLGKKKLQDCLVSPPTHTTLAAVVGDQHPASPQDLAGQGLDGEMDQLLSAQFIQAGHYGTRCTTTLWLTEEGHADFCERSYNPEGELTSIVEQQFPLEP